VEKRFEYFAQLAVMFILVAGCFLVLRPFLAAMMLAAVACVSSWPLYLWLLRRMNGRQNIAAFTMTLSLVLVVILPLALAAYSLADNVTAFYDWIKQVVDSKSIIEPPAWLGTMPIVGESLDGYWPFDCLQPGGNARPGETIAGTLPGIFCLQADFCLDKVSCK